MGLFVLDFSTKYLRCNQTSYNCHHYCHLTLIPNELQHVLCSRAICVSAGKVNEKLMTETVGKQHYEGHTAEGQSPVWSSCAISFYISVT